MSTEVEAEVEAEPEGTFFKASTPDGRWEVEARFLNGRYVGTLTLDKEDIVESLSTDNADRLIAWAGRQMKQAMRRTG